MARSAITRVLPCSGRPEGGKGDKHPGLLGRGEGSGDAACPHPKL